MNHHVKEFYGMDHHQMDTSFKEVIFLGDHMGLRYEDIHTKCPDFPKGYYELCHLILKDRIEFVSEFWEKTLDFDLHFSQFFHDFFSRVEDIGIFLVKKELDTHYQCHLVYSLDDDYTFYKGRPSISLDFLKALEQQFEEKLPQDYLNFFKIHDGFSKDGDLGLIRSCDLLRERMNLEQKINHLNQWMKLHPIDPKEVIPFYKSFGLDVYQCFVKNWYPDKEMGNTLFSLSEGYISDYNDPLSKAKNIAFPTFLDWLVFYMEVIDV